MAAISILLTLLAVGAGAAAHAAAPARGLLAGRHHDRRLLALEVAAAVETARQCQWDAASRTCDAVDAINIMYAVRGQPLSSYLWFLLMTHDRQHACDAHASRDACGRDKRNGCVWLDDVLPASSSGASSGSSKVKAAASEVAAAVPTLQTARMAELRGMFGATLREHLARFELAALRPAMEVLAEPAAAGASPAAGASKAAAKKPAQASSGQAGTKQQMLCTSKSLLENFAFTKTGYSSVLQAPVAMHCPGSKAADLMRCMRQPSNAACSAQAGCVVVPRVSSRGAVDLCVSKHFNSLDTTAMRKFIYDLTLAEPSVVGSCDGACWMRQAVLCNHTTDAASCGALSFCRSMGAACIPKLYTTDNFGSTVQEYLGECSEVDNQADCEGLTLKLVNKGRYGTWHMPRAATSRCYVPSVGGMLGRAAVIQEGGARTELQTVLGQEDERLAATSAAATAAADAARAARLLAEHGAGGLQQLYSSVSAVLGK